MLCHGQRQAWWPECVQSPSLPEKLAAQGEILRQRSNLRPQRAKKPGEEYF